MLKLDPTKFRVSSALKTIIGKELITNDFIAVFELVKNAFDAYATRVDVIFENIYGDKPKLIIKDNGKGMDLQDIVNKWLFVAYSAKKEGVEEDYRDKIQSQRIHAGAKGIGRFSCDKLGKSLILYTKKNNGELNKLTINWEDFEQDAKKEFIDIKVKHAFEDKTPYKNFVHGTVLEITGLREEWNRDKLLILRRSLEKLINPNQENDPQHFSIYLDVPEELINDSESNDTIIVNGIVENKIFENLKIKTTKIEVLISEDGEAITSTLEDRGTLIYRVLEENPYKKILKNINIYLFVLNRSAKLNFTKSMGIPAVQYGSIFLYKNGFRIYPFGEPGQDTLKIDHRKQQGTSRFFGTRDLIGRIEINGTNAAFQETSSRDGGLIRNSAYEALESFFIEYVLKRLEKFAIGVIKWGNDGDLLDHEKLSPSDMKQKASDIVYNLIRSSDVIDVEYSSKLIDILKDRTAGSLKTILANLEKVSEQSNSPLIAKEIRRAQHKYKSLLKAKEEAEAEAKKAKEEAKEASKKTENKISQNLFLQSVLSRDREDMLTFFHQIGISANTILKNTVKLLRMARNNPDFSEDSHIKPLQLIDTSARMIKTVSNFATHANFSVDLTKIKNDLTVFICEYLYNICRDQYTKFSSIQFINDTKKKFICHFKPIEITIILDNLLQNSQKAGAKNFVATIESITDDMLVISFKDDGKGIPSENIDSIFDLGFTTTDGSGIGLFHVSKIVKNMQGKIHAESDMKGTKFTITFRRKNL